MYQALPLGPITLPTGPIFAMLAVFLGLETAGRFGRRIGLRTDDVWNTGLIAVLAGLIVARLWNVFQFWYVYSAEPTLIFSLRPSGFALLPGLIAAFVAAYGYMLRHALNPSRIAAAFSVGFLVAVAMISVSDFLTGVILGLPSDLPWARPYYGDMQHPAALYRAMGFLISIVVVWPLANAQKPGRTVGHVGLATGLVVLLADAFAANSPVTGDFRTSQLVGLVLALVSAAWLAIPASRSDQPAEPVPVPEQIERGLRGLDG